ncbi:SigB/SigF/SigG family RNA polymerase sigma factor [Mariniluteicoccus endophyticus]
MFDHAASGAAKDKTRALALAVEGLLLEAARAEGADRDLLHEQAVVTALPVADSIATRYDGRGIERDDLVQVARLGLIKAVLGYRPGAGEAFLAYCVPTIAGELKRHFRDTLWLVRPPRSVQETMLAAYRTKADIESRGGQGTAEAIAQELGLDVMDVRVAIASRGLMTSAPLPRHDPVHDEAYDSVLSRRTVVEAVNRLQERERELLRLRFVEELSQSDIARRLGISQMQVSRELARLVRRLRAVLTDSREGAHPRP